MPHRGVGGGMGTATGWGWGLREQPGPIPDREPGGVTQPPSILQQNPKARERRRGATGAASFPVGALQSLTWGGSSPCGRGLLVMYSPPRPCSAVPSRSRDARPWGHAAASRLRPPSEGESRGRRAFVVGSGAAARREGRLCQERPCPSPARCRAPRHPPAESAPCGRSVYFFFPLSLKKEGKKK